MKSPLLLASIGMLAAIAGTSSLAHARPSRADNGESAKAVHPTDRHERRDEPGRGMQALTVSAGPGEPGHGWSYFSDLAAGTAVVISPQGEYFHSRGKGLRLVAVTQPGQ